MSVELDRARSLWRKDGDASLLIAHVPYAAWLGVEVRLEPDMEIDFRLPYRDDLIGNPGLPALHGGVTAGFAENAAMLHLLLTMDEPRIPKSVDFSIDYLRSAHAMDLHARCSVQRLGRRVAQVQVSAEQRGPAIDRESGTPITRVVALARVHFLLQNTRQHEPARP